MPAGQIEYRLVRIVPYTQDEIDKLSWSQRATLKGSPYRPPAPIKVPSPPDYSTPAKVSARCRERGTIGAWEGLVAVDTKFRTLLKEFRALVPKLKCRVEDLHVSKYRIVKTEDGADRFTLEEIPAEERKKPAKRPRKAS